MVATHLFVQVSPTGFNLSNHLDGRPTLDRALCTSDSHFIIILLQHALLLASEDQDHHAKDHKLACFSLAIRFYLPVDPTAYKRTIVGSHAETPAVLKATTRLPNSHFVCMPPPPYQIGTEKRRWPGSRSETQALLLPCGLAMRTLPGCFLLLYSHEIPSNTTNQRKLSSCRERKKPLCVMMLHSPKNESLATERP